MYPCSREMIDDITDYIESRFKVGEPTITHLAPTGEPVVTLTCGGIKDQGGEIRVWATDWEKAKESFLAEFDKYAAQCGEGVLYWRRKPEMTHLEYYDVKPHQFDEAIIAPKYLYGFTARLLISNSPLQKDKLQGMEGFFLPIYTGRKQVDE